MSASGPSGPLVVIFQGGGVRTPCPPSGSALVKGPIVTAGDDKWCDGFPDMGGNKAWYFM